MVPATHRSCCVAMKPWRRCGVYHTGLAVCKHEVIITDLVRLSVLPHESCDEYFVPPSFEMILCPSPGAGSGDQCVDHSPPRWDTKFLRVGRRGLGLYEKKKKLAKKGTVKYGTATLCRRSSTHVAKKIIAGRDIATPQLCIVHDLYSSICMTALPDWPIRRSYACRVCVVWRLSW